MDQEFNVLLNEIATLADQRHRPDVAVAARHCRDASRPQTILVATTDPTAVPGFVAWLRQHIPHAESHTVPLGDLAKEPIRAPQADQVVILLCAGEFLDGTTYESVRDVALSRPAGTFAFVFGAAERLQTLHDLERFEAGVTRLLLQETPAPKNGTDVRSQVCFFAQENGSSLEPGLQERLGRDSDVLRLWLTRPLPAAALARYRVLMLLDALEEQEMELTGGAHDHTVEQIQQTQRLRDSLRRCRRNLLDMVERVVESLERELTTSLDTHHRNMVQGLNPGLRNRLQGHEGSLDEALVARMVLDLCTEQSRHWRDHALATVRAREAELAQDAADIAEQVSWQAVNTLLAQAGKPQNYPTVLLSAIQLNSAATVPPIPSSETRHVRGTAMASRHMLQGAVYGGTAGAVAGSLWAVSPLGILIGAGLGAAGGAFAGQRLDQGELLERAMASATSLLTEAMRHTRTEVHRLLQAAGTTTREALEQRFNDVMRLIDQALQQQPRSVPMPNVQPGSDAVQALRQRLAATKTPPAGGGSIL